MLEYKGVDPIAIKNFIRLFVTGNLDWMIPAGFKDRRWAVFDIGEAHMQDNAYFAAIDEEMNNGGREALLLSSAARRRPHEGQSAGGSEDRGAAGSADREHEHRTVMVAGHADERGAAEAVADATSTGFA